MKYYKYNDLVYRYNDEDGILCYYAWQSWVSRRCWTKSAYETKEKVISALELVPITEEEAFALLL